MHLTPLQKDLYKFTSPSALRPALNAVNFNGHRAVATDSFQLVEVKQLTPQTPASTIPDTLITRNSLAKIKTTKKDTAIEFDNNTINRGSVAVVTPSMDAYVVDTYTDTFPKYETIKDDCEKRTYAEITLHGPYLAELCAYLSKFQQGKQSGTIRLRVPTTPNHPLIIEAQSDTEKAYAILMPLQAPKK